MNKLAIDTTFDKIQSYYLGSEDVVLTPKNDEIRQRWEAIHSLQLEYESDRKIIEMITSRFAISEGQAYKDLRNSEQLFGNIRIANKDILRHLVTESAKAMYKAAKDDADFKYMDKALNLIVKANNLDKEDVDLPDPSKVQPPIQVLQISMDFLSSPFAKIVDEKGKKKINEVLLKVQKLLEENQISDFLDTAPIDIPYIPLDGD